MNIRLGDVEEKALISIAVRANETKRISYETAVRIIDTPDISKCRQYRHVKIKELIEKGEFI